MSTAIASSGGTEKAILSSSSPDSLSRAKSPPPTTMVRAGSTVALGGAEGVGVVLAVGCGSGCAQPAMPPRPSRSAAARTLRTEAVRMLISSRYARGPGLVETGPAHTAWGRYSACSSEPSLRSTFFSPASIGTAKRFCFGGIGQLKL